MKQPWLKKLQWLRFVPQWAQVSASWSGTARRWASTRPLDLAAIDTKWRPRWNQDQSQWTIPDQHKGKYYVLPMFPYPSGALHIGHLRNYTISDVIARFRRMCGYHVLHPIGWDAFGLPAENAAIERGVDPAKWTDQNIANMKSQIGAMGGCWDWDRELRTCSPDFYKDTQRLFLSLYNHGMAYQSEALVNWDPIDRTVLANEQVDSNGFSWRSGAKVEQLQLKQWFVKITDYAEALLEDLKMLETDNRWPQHVLAMQRNWLGKSEGANIRFDLNYTNAEQSSGWDRHVQVFTTRPDTLFGVQYIALSSEHPVVKKLSEEDSALKAFIDQAKQLEPDTKAGFQLTTVSARNPLTATAGERDIFRDLPVFVAPYVRSDYGSGAVMGVPAHDTRDFSFWKQNTGRNPRIVILPETGDQEPDNVKKAFTDIGKLSEQCGPYAGMDSESAARQITYDLNAHEPELASVTTKWRLRDWLISRQRYWGCPIPIIHCDSCGPVAVPDKQLPVRLPPLDENQWKGLTGNPLEKDEEWCRTECPKCGLPAKRETDTMDTFVDSSWYYRRFAESRPTSTGESSFMPVDLYIGGVEHAILHLLYARFVHKFLQTTSGEPVSSPEPFQRLLTQGMVHGKTYSDPGTGRFLKPEEVDVSTPDKPRVRASHRVANVSYEKMSKSKHNGVDPLQCMEMYGTDVTRAHLLFQAPPTEVLEWDEEKIVGVERWFGRVWHLAQEVKPRAEMQARQNVSLQSDPGIKLWRAVQTAIVSINQSFADTFALNTVVSDLMTLTNDIQQAAKVGSSSISPALLSEAVAVLLRLMAPIAPSFAEECWALLHQQTEFDVQYTASLAGFPQPDGSLKQLQERTQPCAVQVNGKLKFALQINSPPADLSPDRLQEWILPQVIGSEQWLHAAAKAGWDMKKARKVIVVRGGRTINIVI